MRDRTTPRAMGRATPSGEGEPGFTARRAGEAWLLFPADRPADQRALAFTAHLARDPACTVLVVDLPAGADDGTLEAMVRQVPSGSDGLRLLFGRPPARGAVTVARWLAERLGRTVIVAAGSPLPTPGGGLFIGEDRGAGWIRCAPGMPGVPDSRGFPTPSWESALPAGRWTLGRSVAEALPAGVWLRPAAEEADLLDHRTRLTGQLRVSPELLTVVVGVPGMADLPLADVARFWQELPAHVRPAVRFVCYGPARLGGGRHFGEVLAQVLGEAVRLYNGTPGGEDSSGDVLLVEHDGSPGRPLRAHEFLHLPPGDGAGPVPLPLAVGHRWPLGDLREIRSGTHLLADDVVVEVVPSGLWVRLAQDPPHAAEVRATEPDPGHERVLCDAAYEAELPRLRQYAEDLVRGFPPDLRRAVRMGVCRPTGEAGGREATPPAAPIPGGALTSSNPAPARPGSDGSHTSPTTAHEGLLSLAAEALRRHPELTADRTQPEAVPALAAVLSRLAGDGTLDGPGAARPGTSSGELLRKGLAMLPVHHGATGLRATLDDAMRQWYAIQPLVVEAIACEASVAGPGDAPGNTDFLIWSVNGRRTDALDPLCPDRVLFPPGSRFKVLAGEVSLPDVVMMRETEPRETDADQGHLDRAAARELAKAWRDWRAAGVRTDRPA
ncbi:hypothetical protein [Streptomyces flaveolus]|uniref:hypothetical protein n=1 Tax=Streptomyces flaveolus TaxID=67297 RepID=UPI0037028C34